MTALDSRLRNLKTQYPRAIQFIFHCYIRLWNTLNEHFSIIYPTRNYRVSIGKPEEAIYVFYKYLPLYSMAAKDQPRLNPPIFLPTTIVLCAGKRYPFAKSSYTKLLWKQLTLAYGSLLTSWNRRAQKFWELTSNMAGDSDFVHL